MNEHDEIGVRLVRLEEQFRNMQTSTAMKIDVEKQVGEILRAQERQADSIKRLTEKMEEITGMVNGVLDAYRKKLEKEAEASSFWNVVQKVGAICAFILSLAAVWALLKGSL